MIDEKAENIRKRNMFLGKKKKKTGFKVGKRDSTDSILSLLQAEVESEEILEFKV